MMFGASLLNTLIGLIDVTKLVVCPRSLKGTISLLLVLRCLYCLRLRCVVGGDGVLLEVRLFSYYSCWLVPALTVPRNERLELSKVIYYMYASAPI